MALYIVVNEDDQIIIWDCCWLVEADNAKEAVRKAYYEGGNQLYGNSHKSAAKETGILKRNLSATRVEVVEGHRD